MSGRPRRHHPFNEKDPLSYKSGTLDPHIKVLVNQEGVGAEGLARKVNDGDEIHFVLGTA